MLASGLPAHLLGGVPAPCGLGEEQDGPQCPPRSADSLGGMDEGASPM